MQSMQPGRDDELALLELNAAIHSQKEKVKGFENNLVKLSDAKAEVQAKVTDAMNKFLANATWVQRTITTLHQEIQQQPNTTQKAQRMQVLIETIKVLEAAVLSPTEKQGAALEKQIKNLQKFLQEGPKWRQLKSALQHCKATLLAVGMLFHNLFIKTENVALKEMLQESVEKFAPPQPLINLNKLSDKTSIEILKKGSGAGWLRLFQATTPDPQPAPADNASGKPLKKP
jgi:hypothetical protein